MLQQFGLPYYFYSGNFGKFIAYRLHDQWQKINRLLLHFTALFLSFASPCLQFRPSKIANFSGNNKMLLVLNGHNKELQQELVY